MSGGWKCSGCGFKNNPNNTECRGCGRKATTLPQLLLAHAYTPVETANYGGGDHLVVTSDFTAGRLVRKKGDALCKPRRKFWGLHDVEPEGRRVCKSCRKIAERHSVDVDAMVAPKES